MLQRADKTQTKKAPNSSVHRFLCINHKDIYGGDDACEYTFQCDRRGLRCVWRG